MSEKRSAKRLSSLVALLGLTLAGALAERAARKTVRLEPSGTSVRFQLDATFHMVHGTMRVTAGEVSFDPDTGEISGRVVADARSAETGNRKRDRKMHRQVLESEQYPEIVFLPRRFHGHLEPGAESKIRISGSIEIHGSAHDVEMPATVQLRGDSLSGTAQFTVPFVEWGMKDPSMLMFRVKRTVRIELSFQGHVVDSDLARTPRRPSSDP